MHDRFSVVTVLLGLLVISHFALELFGCNLSDCQGIIIAQMSTSIFIITHNIVGVYLKFENRSRKFLKLSFPIPLIVCFACFSLRDTLEEQL